jgi:hypothetical protein
MVIGHVDGTQMICRYCGDNLDGGDIYEVLKRAGIYSTEENLLVAVMSYGWRHHNRLRFCREIIIQGNSRDQYTICPACKGIKPLDRTAPKKYHSDM